MAQATADARPSRSRGATAAGYLRSSQGGLFLLALLVGVGAGLGAVAFRYLISSFTWLATGHTEFGQQGRVASTHLPWLGVGFFVVIPVAGGLLYGPLIYRWAREARGHGVPEVMIAVADSGGRIRPQVSVVKALASALCIATGGSVGREGPIVQIGSALASSLGQKIKMPENRLRILVACGAAGGISATFNAPITGVFFGVEIILRAFSVEAMFPVMLSAMLADAVAEPILGSGRFLTGFPDTIALQHPANYLLIAALAVIAAFVGLGFKTVLYKIEDLGDAWWGNRPEWARPAVGGVLLGLILLAVPQLYGVGYPVMYQAIAGGYTLWFLILLVFGKMLATSVSLGIGGSGGVFAPSLFLGVMSGTAFGVIADHAFGPAAGPPALYAAVAMGAVFTAAARAPLTSLASVLEMTGDFTLTLPVMLAVAIATTVSRGVSYGTIYTTKLLRRGTDLDRTTPWRALADVKLADAMRPLPTPVNVAGNGHLPTQPAETDAALSGPVIHEHTPQALYAHESLSQALRQLMLYGRDGLPVLSPDGTTVEGWITNASAIHAIARDLGAIGAATSRAELEADLTAAAQPTTADASPNPLTGYQILEVLVEEHSPLVGSTLGTVAWPIGHVPVSLLHRGALREADPAHPLTAGDRVNILARRQPDGPSAGERADVAAIVDDV
ncbi:chloride channel protein [Actinospica durhamensis]|uniref:Chloride channel protein n=1 Tax=Actinospica durhamensis TaxID=1508375 RepID=A0A941EKE2_9ACTN|nr:chloride channel protein [Actinospica durhamensis]MBR7832966.1 chloride channel protein [Actinospica durhamensis]